MPGTLFAPYRKRRLRRRGSTVPAVPSAPATPNTPSPADTATALFSLLSWASAGAAKFDLYFGTSASPPLLIANYVGTTYVPTLSASTTYFWKIVARNDGGTATGPVWSFTTPAATAVLFELDGALMTSRARWRSLTIRDVIGAQPNTASALFDTVAPIAGQVIRIGLGMLDDDDLLFAGQIQSVDESYEELPGNHVWPVNMIDYTFTLNRRRPFASFVDVSASDIARALVAQYAPAFSTAGIQDNLPAMTINFDGSKDFMSCFVDLANGIGDGGWTKVDYARNVHLSLLPPGNAPDPLDSSHPPLNDPAIRFKTDLSQIRTRVYGKGNSQSLAVDVAANQTLIPLPDVSMFNTAGGLAVGGITSDGAQTQIIRYTGLQAGGGGSLVGPGVAPSVAPTATPAAGPGLSSGVYKYAYTDVTASGESLPSPTASITTGLLAAPVTAPTATLQIGGSVDIGAHQYAVTNISASGETTAGPTVSVTTTSASTPDTTPIMTEYTIGPDPGILTNGAIYRWRFTFSPSVAVGAPYVNPTTPESDVGPASNAYTGSSKYAALFSFTGTVPSWAVSYNIYRTTGGGSTYYLEQSDSVLNLPGPLLGGTYNDATIATHSTAPSATSVFYEKVALANIPIGPTGTTQRKIYRTTAGGSQLKLLTTIANNSTSVYTDSVSDASLGADAPTSNSASMNQVSLSAIAIGASGVTQRKLYRTAADASQLKLLATIADNTTTTYGPDTASDASLGANVPTGDTSGLTQTTGQINAGSTSFLTSSAGPFAASGGWAKTGDDYIRYTGISGNTLTGIPTSGSGALLTTTPYGTKILPVPALIGLNDSNGLVRPMERGSKVNILVQRDDTNAQVILASIEGGDGIREYMITDERRGEDSLIELCDADLARFARPIVEVSYCTRDTKTRAGKTVTLDLTTGMFDPEVFDPAVFDVWRAWGLSDEFLIQEVTITFDAPALAPRYAVHASSSRFTFGDLIQRVVLAA